MMCRFPPESWGQSGEETINGPARRLKAKGFRHFDASGSGADSSETPARAMIGRGRTTH